MTIPEEEDSILSIVTPLSLLTDLNVTSFSGNPFGEICIFTLDILLPDKDAFNSPSLIFSPVFGLIVII